MTQKEQVLAQLRRGDATAWGLSMAAGYAPEPSIRRVIGELRASGHTILSLLNGQYRLQTTTASTRTRR